MPDYSGEIAHLRRLLDTGAVTTVIDGQTVSIDPDHVRRRLRELEAEDDSATTRRPRVLTLDMTNVR